MADGLFKGRIAVVTGGARGIGLACAAKIAAGGGRIALWDRDLERAKQSAAALGDAIAVEVDVTSEASLNAALATTEKELAPPDILVASAGITGPNATVVQYPIEAWKQVIDINLTGVFLSNRVVAAGMAKRGWGRIVNISSVNATRGQFGQTNYAAAKAGILGFTKSLAQEVVRKGVTVNAVSPGYVQTDMVMAIREDVREKILSEIPVWRLARPEEIADAVAFLASEKSAYITGTNLAVNGGLHMYS